MINGINNIIKHKLKKSFINLQNGLKKIQNHNKFRCLRNIIKIYKKRKQIGLDKIYNKYLFKKRYGILLN